MDRNNLIKAYKRDMKAMIILLSGPGIIICAMASLQTIEWNLSQGTPIPSLAFLMLALVAFWCISILTLSNKELGNAIKKFEKIIEKLL